MDWVQKRIISGKQRKKGHTDVEVGAGGTDMNADFYGGDFKIDLNEPELG